MESGAVGTSEWRIIRWQRAITEIQAHPLIGKGYGGLENAWIWADMAQFENAMLESDMASGGIHNGYLNGAYSLGIPAVVLFAIAIGGQILAGFKKGRELLRVDPIASDLHAFACANLVGLAASIYIGTDLNSEIIWFYLGFGVLLTRFKSTKAIEVEKSIATEPIPAPLVPRRLPV
jgi:O-antigen ligase